MHFLTILGLSNDLYQYNFVSMPASLKKNMYLIRYYGPQGYENSKCQYIVFSTSKHKKKTNRIDQKVLKHQNSSDT